ncbi:MAG: hypothetical protein FWF66_00520 [Candidatus Bathyarchaeota archaeon]|nr:hypothetical protein [Candidatus Termiticorpusculum sp.]MCL1969947.1 hypothetical protein [Candidatus Termiticorpusculum sp.]
MSDFNSFYWNCFKDNSDVFEVHESYLLTFTNFTYYAEYNKWDNGKEGNYWSDYTGKDNGYGIGKTSYSVYDNFIDNYPLTQPYDVSKIKVTFETWDEEYTGSTWDNIDTGPRTANYNEDDNGGSLKKFSLILIFIIAAIALIASIALLWRFKIGSRVERV